MDRNDQTAGEVLHGCFYDILKQVGVAIPPEKAEAMREACETLAEKFTKIFERDAALPNDRKIQAATLEAFKAYENALDGLEARITALELMRTADVESTTTPQEVPGIPGHREF